MTVAELIEALKQWPDQNMRVIVYGYEGGYHDIKNEFKVTEIILNKNKEWYYGPHEDPKDWRGEKPDEVALLLDRD